MAKAKKKIKVRDMKPKKDAKGGVTRLSSNKLSSNLSSSSTRQLSSASSPTRN